MTTPYEVLGVSANADDDAIKAAFRKAVKLHHPDLNPVDANAGRRLKRLIRARDVLLDRERRLAYDKRQSRRRPHWDMRKTSVTIAAGAFAAIAVFFSQQTLSTNGPQGLNNSNLSDGFDLPDSDAAEIKGLRDWREQEAAPFSQAAPRSTSIGRVSRPQPFVRRASRAFRRLL